MTWKATLAALGLSALMGGCALVPRPLAQLAPQAAAALPARTETEAPPLQPEGASGYSTKAAWAGRRQAVAAAHPLAANAGYQMLRAGGSAVDAAVAVQMVLTLVEPQSSGIGGGAFLLHHDGQRTEAYDGRETAPAAADEALFLAPDGQPLSWRAAVVGGRAVGVPGAVRMLEDAHRAHGKLPWAALFAPAIALAEQGFPISPRLHSLLASEAALQPDRLAAAHFYAYFYDAQGQPWPVGHQLKNPALAEVFKRLAAGGSRALHEGELARAIVDTVIQHPGNPGRMTLADLAGYRARQREPLCHDHPVALHVYRVCGMPPPSSGTLAIGQILGLLDGAGASALALDAGQPSAPWLHLYSEAARLALADRALYVADPDFVAPPGGRWASLLAPAYLRERARLIGPRRMPVAPAGVPAAADERHVRHAPMPEQPEHGTSHISIVDAHGNALAMTTSIESAFGARQMVRGFLLNNELTDFSFAPTDGQGQPVANRVQGGKRPRSSMAPTLVFDKASGELLMTGGSPGGALIIHFTAKLLYGNLHWALTPQQAIDLPNFGLLGDTLLLEAGRFAPATVQALRARGGELQEVPLTSGLQAIGKAASGWQGGADPRREGVVLGD